MGSTRTTLIILSVASLGRRGILGAESRIVNIALG